MGSVKAAHPTAHPADTHLNPAPPRTERVSITSRVSTASDLPDASHPDAEYSQLLDNLRVRAEQGGPVRVVRPDRKKAPLLPKKWLKFDASGATSLVKADKHVLIHTLGLQARDLRLLEPQVSGASPSATLCREHALVVSLGGIKTIITPDYMLVVSPEDKHVLPFVELLHATLKPRTKSRAPGAGAGSLPGLLRSRGQGPCVRGSFSHPNLKGLERDSMGSDADGGAAIYTASSGLGDMPGDAPSEDGGDAPPLQIQIGLAPEQYDMPFELRALEVVLDYVSHHVERAAADLEAAAHPALDLLTKKINTQNLERVRRIKNRLARLNTRVETIRELLEGMLDDDSDMRDMNLTAKRRREAEAAEREAALASLADNAVAQGSLAELQQAFAAKGEESDGEGDDDDVEAVEVVLEPYFMRFDNTFNKLHSLTEYIDDTEDYINIELGMKRNQLIKMDLLLTSTTFAAGGVEAVATLFGMNLGNLDWAEPDADTYWAFVTIAVVSCAVAVGVVALVVAYMHRKKMLFI